MPFEGLLWSIAAKDQSLPVFYDSSKFPFDSGGITTLEDKGYFKGRDLTDMLLLQVWKMLIL